MASKIQGIVVEIGGDTTKLGDALKKVNQQSKSLQTELKGVNTLLKMDPSNVTLLKQKQDLLNKSIAECKEKLNTLKSTQAQVQEQFDKGKITEEQYRDFQREIEATESKLKSLKNEAKEFGSVMSQQFENVGKKVSEVGDKISSAGKKLTVVSAGASAALAGISKNAIDFESAFIGVTKTVDATDEELEKIREGIFDLSESTASSAVDIAAVAEAAGQLGIKTENIIGFSESIVKLGDSTNLTADEAATQLAKFANIMQMSQQNFDKLGSSIVDLGNNFATTEADIVAMAMRLAGAGKQVGLSEGEVLGLATALSSVGIEAEMGGSAISKAMVKMQNAVENGGEKLDDLKKKTGMSLRELELLASNSSMDFKFLCNDIGMTSTEVKNLITAGTNLEDFASVSGMSAEEFKKAWKEDASGALSAFVQGLGNAEEKGESAITMLTDMGLTEVRLRDSLLRAANSGSLFNDAIETGTKAWDENIALTNEATKRYASTESKISQLKSTITELCVKLGETLLPIIQSIVAALSKFVNWLTNLSPTMQKVILVVVGLLAVIGPLLLTIGKFVFAIGSIIQYGPKILGLFTKLKTALLAVKTAITAVFTAMAANPITIVIAIIGALIAAFVLLWNKCEGFRNFWINLWEKIKSTFMTIIENIKTGISNFLIVLGNIKDWIKTNVLAPIWNSIQEFLATVRTIVEWINLNVIQPILSVVVPIVQKISEITLKIWEIITVLFGVLCQWVYNNVIFPLINIIKNFVNSVKEFIQNIWNKIVEIFSLVAGWISARFTEAKNAIINAFSPVIQWFSDRWNDIKNIFSGVGYFFSNVFYSAVEGIKGVFNGIRTFFSNLWRDIKGIFSNVGTSIATGIGDSFKNILNSVLGFIQNKINSFINSINNAITTINNIPGVNISKISKLQLPKFKNGKDYIPYDNYLALLHKGERVLTAEENKEYNKNKFGDGKNIVTENNHTTNLNIENFHNNREQDIQGLAEELEFYRLKYANAKGG